MIETLCCLHCGGGLRPIQARIIGKQACVEAECLVCEERCVVGVGVGRPSLRAVDTPALQGQATGAHYGKRLDNPSRVADRIDEDDLHQMKVIDSLGRTQKAMQQECIRLQACQPISVMQPPTGPSDGGT